jgi:putative transposase
MSYLHKNIRLAAANYIGQRWYFVTLCCNARHKFFVSKSLAKAAIEHLAKEAIRHNFAVYAYCVMPDHLHILVYGTSLSSDLLAFIKAFKKITSFEFENQFRAILWQKKYYDRILRPSDRVAPIAAYIWMNPVRASLCVDPKAYPFSGSLVLDWSKVKLATESWLPPWKQESAKPA